MAQAPPALLAAVRVPLRRCALALAALALGACGGGGAPAGGGTAAVPAAAPAAASPCPEVLPAGWSHRRLVLAPQDAGTLVVEFSDRDLRADGADVPESIGGEFTRHGVRLVAPLEGRPEEPLVLDVLWRALWPVDLVSLAAAFYGENGENAVQGLRGWPEEGVVLCELRLSLGGTPLAAAEGGFRIPAPRNVGALAAADLGGDVLPLPRGARRLALARLWWDEVEPAVALAPEGEGLLVDGRPSDPHDFTQPALLLFVRLE